MKTYAIIAAAFLSAASLQATAATITYTDSAAFLGTLGNSVTDDYGHPPYTIGDIYSSVVLNYSDAGMSAVRGETDYTTPNGVSDYVYHGYYCNGCQGSFGLTFTSTSVGNSAGVYGAGFNFINLLTTDLFHAFVTFGDGSTVDYALPQTNDGDSSWAYFGIASDQLIKSIYLGGPNGAARFSSPVTGTLAIDNLTIGAAPTVPVPAAAWLFGSGLIGLVGIARKRTMA